MKSAVLENFEKNNGTLKADELYSNGITQREIDKLLDLGKITRIKRGYYQLADIDEPNETATIKKLFPEAILCMDTALFYYNYSDRTPLEWCIAVDRNISKSRFKLSYPLVKPYYIDAKYLNIGIVSAQIDGIDMRIYDRERVICDCLRQMNKMNRETFNRAIQSYINDPKMKVKNLSDYAKQLRVYNKAHNMIGVWL
jgi:predicted transcriptional regulator of viral defense system